MKVFVLIGLVALSLCHLPDPVTITREYLEELKKVAEYDVYDYESHPFKDLTSWELRNKLGLKGLPYHEEKKVPYGEPNDNLPTNFLVADKWPNCVHSVRDQQSCGSCWAFALSEVLSDRFCIASDGAVDVILSPQDSVSCDSQNLGCNGGYLDLSWDYVRDNGIVSDDCYPYTSGSGQTGTCRVQEGGKCTDGKTTAVKYYISDYTYPLGTVQAIKTELYNNGPVETGFNVYQDFMSYRGGIYKKKSNVLMGGHAVKIVGWGVEGGTEYWVVANSWGSTWGEKGHFRMAVGNCCNFEAQTITGTPLLPSSFLSRKN
jgi:cathepsin B